MSVPQIAVFAIRIITSLWPTSGFFTRVSVRPGARSSFANAFIVSPSADDAERAAHACERVDRAVDLRVGVCGAHLRADARLALGNDRVREPDHVDAFGEERVRHSRRELRVAQQHRDDRMPAGHEREAVPFHPAPEALAVRTHALAQRGALAAAQELDNLQRGGGDARRERVREEVRPRALAQQVDDLAPCRDVAARRAAHRLPERPGQDVDAALDAAMLGRAAPTLAHEADRVRIVDHHERAVAIGQVAYRPQVRDGPVHREDAVGGDQLGARARGVGLAELRLEVRHVVVAVAIALRLAEPDAVDDARVVELVADDGVLLPEQRLEETAVRVEAARVEDRRVGAEERGERALERRVDALRPADEAYRREAEAPPREAVARRGDEPRVVREPQVVVRAEVEHAGAALELDFGRLRARDDALSLFEAVGTDPLEGGSEAGEVSIVHRAGLGAAG